MTLHPAAEAFRGLVDSLTAPITETRVEYEDDPRQPGRTGIRITGPTREAVQHQIDKVRAPFERNEMLGHAIFFGPSRIRGGYGALGETVVEASE